MKGPSTETQADAESLSYSVVESVARHKGTEALSLDPPLYEVLDPDALDVLFTGEGGMRCAGEISFEYSGCWVTVSSDGHVFVEDDSVREPPTS
ncbi:hypothetical protein HUG10_07740 [Halorarum halophilum]|uniref:Halobacterial output domain-containing protein n=1 Tax=Halorarum halophilum TaxID=2743090 RepID=A0A7D5GKQ3_9EURY|nr:HalOD1 output domain-containing protein [Halobaculum halophilum]QLG27447.1 hypothetical protein HUG10_07740 [Halobaculum halophilum]